MMGASEPDGGRSRPAVAALAQICQELRIGKPVSSGALSYVPLAPERPSHRAAAVPLAQALADGWAELLELDPPRVEALVLRNRSHERALIARAGELLCGGRQDRVQLSTMLLSPRSSARIAVCCVERRRWHGGTRLTSTGQLAGRSVRRLFASGRDIESHGRHLQHGQLMAIELFGAPEHFAHYNPALFEQTRLDRGAPARADHLGEPLVAAMEGGVEIQRCVRRFLPRLESAAWTATSAGGRGWHLHAEVAGLDCAALVADGQLIHLQVEKPLCSKATVHVAGNATGNVARVEIELEGHEPIDVRLRSGRWLVGRHPQCDVQILSPTVSRRHAWLTVADDGIAIRDAGSSNGTWVGGEAVAFAQLAIGDAVRLGRDVRLRCLRLSEPGGP